MEEELKDQKQIKSKYLRLEIYRFLSFKDILFRIATLSRAERQLIIVENSKILD